MTLLLRSTALSDVGRVRKDNQDSGYAGPYLLAVADGVGGAARGDVASSAAIEALRKLDVPPGNDALSELAATIHLAHDRLAEIVEQHPELDGTSTTVTATIFDGTHLRIGHVGDSRGYLLRDGVIRPITTDHTLVQSLIDEGRITEAEARVHPHRNLILRAVDGVHEPEPDLSAVEVSAGDRVLLCSDGCSGVLEDKTLAELMTGPLEDAAQRLVRSALEAGSSDNVTVILADILEDPDEVDDAATIVGAAATTPHLRMNEATGNLSERDVAVLSAADAKMVHIDPEEIRYAPQAPRRFVWLRRLVVVAVLAGLVGFGAKWLYDATQEQYFVRVDGDELVIYQGIDVDLPLLNSVHARTGLKRSNLTEPEQATLVGNPSFDTLAEADKFVGRLRDACVQQVPVHVIPVSGPFWAPWLQTNARYAAEVADRCGT